MANFDLKALTPIKHDGELYLPGEGFSADELSAKRLLELGAVEVIEETEEIIVKTEEIIEETEEFKDLSVLTVAELQDILNERGIEYKAKAKKEELIELIESSEE